MKKSIQTNFHIEHNQITGIQGTDTIKIIIIQTTTPKYKPKNCKWCNTIYTPTSSHNLYCCEDCRILARQKYGRDRINRFRKRYKEVLKTFTKYMSLGTGGLGEHPTNNFEEEQEKIIKELKKLGIR